MSRIGKSIDAVEEWLPVLRSKNKGVTISEEIALFGSDGGFIK